MIDHLVATTREIFARSAVPVLVELGPDRFEQHEPGRKLVIWRDHPSQAETCSPPSNAQGNPPHRGDRMLAATARFYVSSGLDGPMISDHQRLCDEVVDAFICALYEWGKSQKLGAPPIRAGGYVLPPKAAPAENFAGVIYELHFGVPRGVLDRPRREFTVTGVSTTAKMLGPLGGDPEAAAPPVVAPAPVRLEPGGGLPTE